MILVQQVDACLLEGLPSTGDQGFACHSSFLRVLQRVGKWHSNAYGIHCFDNVHVRHSLVSRIKCSLDLYLHCARSARKMPVKSRNNFREKP